MDMTETTATRATRAKPVFSAFRFGDNFNPANPGLWLFLPIALVVGFLVIPPLLFIVYSSFTPSMTAHVHSPSRWAITEISSPPTQTSKLC